MPNIKTILIIGASGQLGQSIKALENDYSDYIFTFTNREQLDLNDQQNTAQFFQQNTFDLIINCAAYTAVDKAEFEPELADAINHLAVKQLTDIAKRQQAKFIHISTDYVFDGQQHRPYIESDAVQPQGVYGLSKLKGEQALLEIMPNNGLIIRTSWLYSQFGNNFVKTMLKLGQERGNLTVIFDQIGSPTYANDLAQAIMKVVSKEAFDMASFTTEIYNYSNEGVCSWYDFAKTIFELTDIECNVSPIETKDYPTPTARPHYSALNKTKIKQAFDITIPYWKESLQQCLKALQGKE